VYGPVSSCTTARFGDVGRHDPARTVVLEAARDEVHAVREQRGRERVALEALIGAAVERERQRNRAIDAATGAEAVFLAHLLVPLRVRDRRPRRTFRNP
jgi:hypothetical protein